MNSSAAHKRKKGIPPSTIRRPLTEVVETVAKHQAAGFSPSTTEGSIPNAVVECKGGGNGIFLVEHEWPGLQSVQFNWALDNLPIEAKWVLRLDADEYLTPESIEWLKANLDGIDEKVSALEFTLERKFMGGIRYFLKLGFLDGVVGLRSVSQARLSPRFARPSKLVFRLLRQELWYRWIVDREIRGMKRGEG